MSDLVRGEGTGPESLRLGVFYDGGWFSHLWHFMADHSPWRAKLNFFGVHGMLRWHLHRVLGVPVEAITVEEAHYMLGRPGPDGMDYRGRAAAPMWDLVLRRSGVTRHDAKMTEVGELDADSRLNGLVSDRAREATLDVVALVSGDSCHLSLIRRLHAEGVRVIVPTIYEEYPGDYGERERVYTAPGLGPAADFAPDWMELIAGTLKDRSYRLAYPFEEQAAGQPVRNGRDRDGWRYGTVNRWENGRGFGFVTDSVGVHWYVEARAFRDGAGLPLALGCQVRFTGKPTVAPGKKYPQINRAERC
ncbi:hypothetical protein Aple_050520 [Acrocarpospora pleiomorpha]|uniref:CSD domain-containing protein n=1 Tax=Acrocarpospora pleiomorpha TaxID=90975 RepID=A0A5M3XLA1_9ACTN|nr:hypothetical protein [Acrocarpospora pleiomorpha]GES22155.1 hypothetical protein Aple_050520 [Acrocarpospora pleiomorpha]